MWRAQDFPVRNPFVLFLIPLLALSFAARAAVDVDMKLEPGVGFVFSSPQKDRFELGGAATLKGIVGFEGGWLNLAAGLTILAVPAQTGFQSTSAGTAVAPSFGFRIQLPRESDRMRQMRPHQEESFYGAKPWFDTDIMYVRTGPLDRVGFAAAVGVAYPLGEERQWQIGPFVRYFQIFQGGRAGYDTGDANTIILGISLQTGARFERSRYVEPAPAPVEAAVESAPKMARRERPDRDGDGVPDDVDACPDMPGPASNSGCPVYEKVVVKPDMLELKEKIQFAWNQALIEKVSYPALDEVAQALKDNKGFKISIEGHASSEGVDDQNQTLSDKRALAVLDYIASKGISRDRLVSEGFSSSRPIKSNTTEAGREANRRVEFVVHFIILKEGSLQ